jgi:hypothetical protein
MEMLRMRQRVLVMMTRKRIPGDFFIMTLIITQCIIINGGILIPSSMSIIRVYLLLGLGGFADNHVLNYGIVGMTERREEIKNTGFLVLCRKLDLLVWYV